MLRTVPILLVILGLMAPHSFAQQASGSRKVSTPIPVAKPVERKPSFFERLFGRRPKPTPAPATPAPTPRARKNRPSATKPTTRSTSKPRSSSTTTKPAETTTDRPATEKPATSAPAETSAEKPTPKPAAKRPTKPAATASKTSPPPPPGNPTDPEELDKFKYDTAKAKAMEDPEVQALKQKADEAVSDEEANKAQRAYNKALFAKMRKLDPLIKERIDRMEAAMMKRLNDQPGAR